MPKRCPNLADDAVRGEFNGLLRRLGGRPLERLDVAARQGYLARLTPAELAGYAKAHALWDRHASPGAAQAFLDSLDRLKAVVGPEGPPPVAQPAAAATAAGPLRSIDALAGTVPEAERAITRAPVGTWVAIGDQLWKRTDADPVRPWQGSDGEALSTAGLLDRARAARNPEGEASTRPAEGTQAYTPPQTQTTSAAQPGYRAPQTLGERSEIQNKYRIIRQLEAALNVPIRTGRVGVPGARGVFKIRPEVIRLRGGGDLTAVLHEIGHFLRKRSYVDFGGYSLALEALGSGFEGDPIEEGIAEFTRLFVADPVEAEARAPGLPTLFAAQLERRWPEGLEALLGAREQYAAFREAPLLARTLATTESGASGRYAHLRAGSFAEWWGRFYNATVDDLTIVRLVQEAATQGRTLSADEDAYLVGRVSRTISAAEMFLRRAPVDFNTLELRRNIKPVEEAIKPVWRDRARFDAYLQYRTVLEDLDSGDERLVRGAQTRLRSWETDRRELDQAFAALDSPAFRQAAADLDRLNEALLDYVGASGRYSPETLATLRRLHRHHAPLYTIHDDAPDLPAPGSPAGQRLANLPNPIKTRRGSERPVISPLQSIVRNIQALVSVANRNEVMALLASHVEGAEGLGRLMERVPPVVRATTFPLEEIRRTLEAAGFDVEESEADLDTLARVFRPTRGSEANIVTIYRRGRAEEWQLDPALARVAAGLDHWTVPWFLKFFALAKSLFRGGIVLHPQFAIANMLKDQATVGAQSPHGIPFYGYGRGLVHLLADDAMADRWRASGAPVFSQLLSDPEVIERHLRRQVEGPWGAWHRLRSGLRARAVGQTAGALYDVTLDAMHAGAELAELSEAPTRIGVFERALGQPQPEDVASARPERAQALRAAYEAREASVDFSRHGASSAVRAWSLITAFFNPGIQGADKFFRASAAHPWRVAAIGAALLLAELLLYLHNREQEGYWKGTNSPERDLSWIYVPSGGGPPIKLPGPFEWKAVFSAVPRRIFEWIDRENPAVFDALAQATNLGRGRGGAPLAGPTGWEAIKGIGGALGQAFSPNLIPTAFQPVLENAMNYSTYFDRPVVPRGVEGRSPGMQYTDTTPEIARRIGGAVGYPPAKVEYLIEGYGGNIGRDVAELLDVVLRPRERGEPPAPRLGDYPILRRFVGRTPKLAVDAVQEFYRLLDDKRRARTDRRVLQQEGLEVPEEMVDRTQGLDAFERASRRFADIRRRIGQIADDPTLSPAMKRQDIDELVSATIDAVTDIVAAEKQSPAGARR